MAYPIWQVGLDIQNGFMRALAVQRRRHGWQLRHWWQLPLPGGTLSGGSLHHPAALCTVLRQWRQELPRFVSLRLGFPASRVLQQRLALPDRRLREPRRGEYIGKMAAKALPIGGDDLALDYRPDPQTPNTLLVTAARQTELNIWLHCLRDAGLQPDAVDITPCALRCMAAQAGLATDRLLLHRFDDHWLWVAPLAEPLAFGTFYPDDIYSDDIYSDDIYSDDISSRSDGVAKSPDVLKYVSTCYQNNASHQAYLSASAPEYLQQLPATLIPWSPLSAFERQQPPLPTFPAAFAIAGGLAMRPEDTPC
ncbi:type IV pilus biogenesis protein PilM [Dickeya fangzhongdai]|uniref:type IV pilus biogenesis protein PilM n=1 Tax=Dickeya fangzhongdai TaxID=1778540 RepID=UPI0004F735E2|nr:pilus assembly protein PilM [Dickeya fangzhongdai]AIR70325.1 pilus assembly protein HofM [Dickeya fangzhongdai]KGT98948.1 pilus assembly protein HofM [Dickeya fangzhongdai]